MVLLYQFRKPVSSKPGLQPSGSIPPSLEQKRSVRLFFSSPTEDALQEEVREIKLAGAIDQEARVALMELIKGPRSDLLSTLPPGTQLRQLYIDGRGIAYVDFSAELRDRHPGGSNAELLAVYSIVDTLAYNFEQIKRVQILVNGSEIDTLAGHVDLRRPLKPRIDIYGAS
jgi:spore germination protein GerM